MLHVKQIACLCAISAMLIGCGQKGPLYIKKTETSQSQQSSQSKS